MSNITSEANDSDEVYVRSQEIPFKHEENLTPL